MDKSHTTSPFAQRGFSIIEIMVAIAIIAIMAGTIGPKLFGNIEKANKTRAKSDIQTIGGALDIYRLDNHDYPTTDQGIEALLSPPSDLDGGTWNGPYLKKAPKDPWNRDYQYLSPGENGDYDLYSLGKDGRPGGEGDGADITSWE